MARLTIHQLPILSDNYVYLLHDAESGATAVVDPGEAAPVQAALAARGWSLSHILLTHHHNDHVGGVATLRDGAVVIGGRADRHRLPELDQVVGDGDSFLVGTAAALVMDVPGHTGGHIAYWFPETGAVFCGDTLFSLGCGRLFDGTAAQLWASLCKLRDLPGETLVYCAHEYTAANGRFARTVERDNEALQARIDEVAQLRARHLPTVPSTIATERATNPFLRADLPSVKAAVGMAADADPAAAFAELRRRKDAF